jgi:hypothetical protein
MGVEAYSMLIPRFVIELELSLLGMHRQLV